MGELRYNAQMNTPKLNWTNVTFFGGTFLIAVIGGTVYTFKHGITWLDIALFFGMTILSLMSISAGYHRLYAHRTHESATWLKLCYLVFGAASFEQSCMKWATEHRLHHRFVDTDKDPYNVKKGGWWAHIGWIIYEDPAPLTNVPQDLLNDPLIVWQQKNWVWIGILVGFVLPMAIGAVFGNPWGGLLFGGVIRLVTNHHATFCINSLAHMIGDQTYTDRNTARDSWITAIFTFGEGYHNFHHWSPGDYRNGVRRYHWDPPKWWIRAMDALGQSWDVKRMPEEAIVRARLEMQRQRAEAKGAHPKLNEMYEKLMAHVEHLGRERRTWMEAKKAASAAVFRHEIDLLKTRFEEARATYRESYKAWKRYLRTRTLPA